MANFPKPSIAGPAILLFGLIGGATADAQVATDGTVGPRVELGGPEFAVGAELGRQAVRNLFHSFEHFSLATGERATFSGPDQIRNVISRVTGGARSDIDGTIRSTIPGADFYFINPAGVLFGPNAGLDLQGSFHVSSADQLRFADGQVFSADLEARSSFTVAAPEAFGFLGTTPASILVDRSTLEVLPGEALSLVGGDVIVDGGGTQALLLARSGLITLAAVGGPGEAELASGAVMASRAADIRLADGATIATSGDGGGTIRVRGGTLVMENQSFLFADNGGSANAGGGIEIDAEAATVGSGSALTASAFGAGTAGTVKIVAGELEVREGGRVVSNTHAGGDAGSVAIDAGRLLVSGAGVDPPFAAIGSFASSGSTGAGGAVTVTASEVEVRDGGAITGSTFTDRDAGTVTVTAGTVAVRDDGVISGATFGRGAAGTVTVIADKVEVHDGGVISSRTEATGAGGALMIRADLLAVDDGGAVETISFGSGAPGTIELRVDRLHLRDGGFVAASAAGQDTPAGDMLVGSIDVVAASEIVITGQRLDALSGQLIPSNLNTQTLGARPAGPLVIRTPVLRMSQFGAIESSTLGDGSAGAIGIVVDRLLMGPGAVIGSSAAGGPDALGGAGTIEITAADSITMAGSPARELAAIGTVNMAAGPGGSVTITTARLHIVRGGISTDSIATGNAGNILVVATDRLVLDDGSISAEADIAGGGRITIDVAELIDLQGSELATSVAGDATTTAGDITIDPRFIILEDSRIVAQAGEGRGGNIRITVDNLIQSPDSLISASAGPAGIDGTVVVSTPGLDLSSELVRVEGAVIGDALIREKCASRRDIGASSFTALGRGGLPPSPGGPLHGTYLAPSDGGGADERGSTAAPSDSRWSTEASCLDAPIRAAAR